MMTHLNSFISQKALGLIYDKVLEVILMVRKIEGEIYRCQDCGLVVRVQKGCKKDPVGELMCCTKTMTK
jgi:hypothetical protein